jgi:hypothetical protein
MLGLAVAGMLGNARGTPVVYWSLEITFLRDLHDPVSRSLKRLERKWSRKAVATLIQDRCRAASLAAENGIPAEKFLIVPNSPAGPSTRQKSAFLRTKFALPDDSFIILHTGMLSPEVLSLEIASDAARWPDGWRLIFHERARRSIKEPYVEAVAKAGQGRVLLSLDPVPYDELHKVVASGYIGLVFYRTELGPNYALAGSSGKLGSYLRHGLPVVCLALPGLTEVIQQFRCGICVSDVTGIAPAIRKIRDDYATFCMNATKCYDEMYEFDRHFAVVSDRIEQLCRTPRLNLGSGRNGAGPARLLRSASND